MKELYRGHDIVVLEGNPRSAVIFERRSGTELPTKVIALPEEGAQVCVVRARQLIDLYLETGPQH